MTDAGARRPGASELLRGLGLLVDGPARWGNPVTSRKPGVFVVELPNGLPDAPVDIIAVRRWLEHVPDLLLDGERPTPQEVAKRLHEFWLADEPVLYVGRSARQVGPRVGAMYATQLGDTRPYAGGHWLKTLSVLNELRVWWADTDAHEEYEDALLAEIAARNLGTPPVIPFANLAAPDGTAKAHGLLNSLRSEAPDAASTPAKGSSTSGRKPAARRAVAVGGAGARKPSSRAASSTKPPAAPTMLSREGLEKLTAELEDMRTVQRPEIIARVAAARELGDLKENADYEYARKEQSFLEGRIQTVEQMLRTGVVIERDGSADVVHLGSTVDVETDGESATYVIVGSTEANPAAGRLSNASPVGRALVGAKPGDDVVVELPSGSVRYRIVAVR